MSSIEKAKKLMEARLVELEQERKAIKAALASLGGQTTDGPRRSKRRRRTATRVRRGERQVQFVNVVGQHPGEPISAIAREMGVKPQQLYPIARRLSDAGTIAKFNGGYKATAAKAKA
jgi:DNA-binding MarR family transcriptional regulator